MRSLMNKCLNIRTIGKMTNQVSSTYECSTEGRTRTLWNIHSPIFLFNNAKLNRKITCVKYPLSTQDYRMNITIRNQRSIRIRHVCMTFVWDSRNLRKMGLKFSNLRFKPKTFTRSNNIYVVTHFVVPNAFRVTTSTKESFSLLQDFPSWYQE